MKEMETIRIEKMTCKQLRALPYNKETVFKLPTAREILNACALAYKTQYLIDSRFTTRTDFIKNTLTITRRKPRKEDTDGVVEE